MPEILASIDRILAMCDIFVTHNTMDLSHVLAIAYDVDSAAITGSKQYLEGEVLRYKAEHYYVTSDEVEPLFNVNPIPNKDSYTLEALNRVSIIRFAGTEYSLVRYDALNDEEFNLDEDFVKKIQSEVFDDSDPMLRFASTGHSNIVGKRYYFDEGGVEPVVPMFDTYLKQCARDGRDMYESLEKVFKCVFRSSFCSVLGGKNVIVTSPQVITSKFSFVEDVNFDEVQIALELSRMIRCFYIRNPNVLLKFGELSRPEV